MLKNKFLGILMAFIFVCLPVFADEQTMNSHDKNLNIDVEENVDPAILVNDYEEMHGKLLQSELYGVRFFSSIPVNLRDKVSRDQAVLMMTTVEDDYKVLMVIPKNLKGNFYQDIRSHKKMSLVYMAIGFHHFGKKTYPVLEYRDVVK